MDRIDTLKAFVAVADARSFVAASRRLGRSPAAITRAVAALENRIDTRLFTRTTRAVVLTEAGRRYLDRTVAVLRDLAALDAEGSVDSDVPQGTLSVTASVVFGRMHVLPIVCAFLRRYPAVDVRLTLDDHVVSLVDGGIDVGVRIAHLPDSSLKAVRVGTVRRAVYASPAYLAAHGEPQHPRDLAAHACIAFSGVTATPGRWSFRVGRKTIVISVTPRLVVNLAEAAIDSASAGLGLTCVLSYMVDHLVAADLLRPVLRHYEHPPLPVHVVYPSGPHLPNKTRLFIDDLGQGIRRKLGAAAR